MMSRLKLLIIIVAGATMVSCYPAKFEAFKSDKKVRNVIFLIGDGMGLPHVQAAMTAAGVPLNIQRTEVTGLQTSHSADNYITDSAASGTALSSGVDEKAKPANQKNKQNITYKLAQGIVTTHHKPL